MAYLSLVELDKCNLRCGKLINTIKEINPFMFQLVFLFGHKKLNLIVNVYKKIVFRGGCIIDFMKSIAKQTAKDL